VCITCADMLLECRLVFVCYRPSSAHCWSERETKYTFSGEQGWDIPYYFPVTPSPHTHTHTHTHAHTTAHTVCMYLHMATLHIYKLCVCSSDCSYVRGYVQKVTQQPNYEVAFDDGSVCTNLPPGDILVGMILPKI